MFWKEGMHKSSLQGLAHMFSSCFTPSYRQMSITWGGKGTSRIRGLMPFRYLSIGGPINLYTSVVTLIAAFLTSPFGLLNAWVTKFIRASDGKPVRLGGWIPYSGTAWSSNCSRPNTGLHMPCAIHSTVNSTVRNMQCSCNDKDAT
jgi:hypothetical protein